MSDRYKPPTHISLPASPHKSISPSLIWLMWSRRDRLSNGVWVNVHLHRGGCHLPCVVSDTLQLWAVCLSLFLCVCVWHKIRADGNILPGRLFTSETTCTDGADEEKFEEDCLEDKKWKIKKKESSGWLDTLPKNSSDSTAWRHVLFIMSVIRQHQPRTDPWCQC